MSATAVLDALRAGGPMDGTGLIAATGLSRPTVHQVCNDLIAPGQGGGPAVMGSRHGRAMSSGSTWG